MTPWGDLAAAMAQPWPGLQNDDGTFPDYVFGGRPGFSARYGESMLGYGLLRTGVREDDRRLIDAGLRGVSYAVGREDLQRDRPSVFESLAVAAAYNLGRRHLEDYAPWERRRAPWATWLRRVRLLRVDTVDRFVNKQAVEAVGVLEMLRTGVHSSRGEAVLGGRRARARELAIDLVDRRIPAIAAGEGTEVGGRRALLLSDPPSNPPAYHALALGFLARAVDLLGERASPRARSALRAVVEASWRLAAPDGDLSFHGRSQEQAWTLACTAYGALVAAREPGSPAASDARYAALADRALRRLADRYPVGPRGMWIVPALAKDPQAGGRGMDGYAGASVYCGLTLVALGWALDAMGDTPPPAGAIAADAEGGARVSRGESEVAVARAGDVWLAVKAAPSLEVWPQDLRYDFGVVALKRRGAAGWTDLVPIRPRTHEEPDSAGPVLRGEGGGRPAGEGMEVRGDGTVVVQGGFRARDGAWRRRGGAFTFAPAADGVRLTFPARADDRFELSVFFAGAPVHVGATTVADATLAVESDALTGATFEDGYASGAEPRLVRARLALRAAADGPLSVRLRSA